MMQLMKLDFMMGSNELDSVDGSTLPASAGTSTITFNDLSDDLDITDGESVTLTLEVQVSFSWRTDVNGNINSVSLKEVY